MNFFIQSLPIILLLASYSSVTALKWAAPHPITVEGDVIRVNKPTKLTCDYVKTPRENVKEVKWTYVQGGLRAPIFTFKVSQGTKEGPEIGTVQVLTHESNTKDVVVILPRMPQTSKVTFECEVSGLKGRHGRQDRFYEKKMVEVNVVDAENLSLTVKKGQWNDNRYQGRYETSIGQPLTVSCISQSNSRSSSPGLSLSLSLNGNSWPYGTRNVIVGVPYGSMVIEGRIDRVQSRDFQHGIMKVECKATQGNVEIAKEALDLRKQYGGGGTIVSDNPVRDQHRTSWNNQLRPGQQIGHHDEAHDADVIHHRLLELLDPSKHMHPGIPYDFYSGYILMVADNIDTADNSGSGGYSSYNRNTPAEPTTFLYGKLTPDTVRDLRAKIGGFYEVSAKKHKLVQNPVDVLDILGQHSYRVIGFTAEADKKMVWTLEQKDFEGHL